MSETVVPAPVAPPAGAPAAPVPVPAATPQQRANASVRTYRYLRLTLVALVLLLLGCVFGERWSGPPASDALGSISAYYYTSVRSVFVGVLVAIGVSLVAIVGRRGFEDTALNVAGMLAPVVAFVPTPRAAGGAPCRLDETCSVPPEFVPSVVNNVWGLLGLGLLGLALGALTAFRAERSRSTRIGWGVAAVVWLLFLLWFWRGRDAFLEFAHYTSAVLLFVAVTGVAIQNARRAAAGRARLASSVQGRSYTVTYSAVALVMAFTLVAAVGLALKDKLGGGGTPEEWVLWVEVVLLVAFGTFWGAQTADYWHDGLPEDPAGSAPTDGAAPAA